MGRDGVFGITGWALITLALVFFGALALVTHLVAERVAATPGRRSRVMAVVSPLTPALAALFAVMVAFTVVTEAGYLRTAQTLANDEATAASRLAWASTTPGVDGAPIRDALGRYLEVVVRYDWAEREEGARTPAAVQRATERLERRTRDAALVPGTTPAVASELLTSLDAVTTTRRALVGEASRRVPGPELAVLALAGMALVVNVSILTASAGRRGLDLIWGVVAVVAASLALLVGISAPFLGPLRVGHQSIDRVVNDLHDDFFMS